MTSSLLASAAWVLDLAFFLILILGTAHGAYRGFVWGICKLAGRIASVIFAVVFCVSFANFLELCFHMTTGIANGIGNAIAKNAAYAAPIAADIAGADVAATLKGMDGVSGIAIWFIGATFKKVALIPAGTTPAMMIGSALAKWISIAIAFVLLILLIRLGAFAIHKTFSALKNALAPLRVVDQALGAILGLAKACALVFILLLICNWLPIDALHTFIGSSGIVGRIFQANWFQAATSYAISGQWFDDYVRGFLAK